MTAVWWLDPTKPRLLGIGMGVPEFQIRPLLRAHQVQVFSSNYTLYGDMSQRVMETLEQFSPDIEVYSIDEAFLSLSGLTSRNLTEYGRTIRRTVKQWTGIPVSVGIAETKTLAKIANRVAKRTPDIGGVFDLLACPDRDALLGRVPVEDVWGIGPNHARLLKQHGITTALQLREVDDQWIRKRMGIVGLRLVMELRGVSCLDLEQCPAPKQGLTCSRAFGTLISTLAEMEEAVSVLYLAGGGEAETRTTGRDGVDRVSHHERIQRGATVQQRADAEAARCDGHHLGTHSGCAAGNPHNLSRRVSLQEGRGDVHRLGPCQSDTGRSVRPPGPWRVEAADVRTRCRQ